VLADPADRPVQDAERIHLVGVDRRLGDAPWARVGRLDLAELGRPLAAILELAPFVDRVVSGRDVQPVAEPLLDPGPVRQAVALPELQEEALGGIGGPVHPNERDQRFLDRLVIRVQEALPRPEVIVERLHVSQRLTVGAVRSTHGIAFLTAGRDGFDGIGPHGVAIPQREDAGVPRGLRRAR
jgi:hypothetical protein